MATQAQAQKHIIGVAVRIWPNFALLDERERTRRLLDLVGIVYALPLAVFGVIWLAQATQPLVLLRSWRVLLALGVLLSLLGRRPFFWVSELRPGRYERYEASLSPMAMVAGLLLVGPSGLWLPLIDALLSLAWRLPRLAARTNRVRELRRRLLQMALVPALLGGAWAYRLAGGVYPLAQLNWVDLMPAVAAVTVLAFGTILIYLGYSLLSSLLRLSRFDQIELLRLSIQLVLIILPALFGTLLAAITIQLGLPGLVFFGFAALLATLAANQLSYANIDNSQRTRELEQLEQLGRAIIATPADELVLPNLLAAYVPFMFQYDQIDIRLFPDETLLHTATRPISISGDIWEWLGQTGQSRAIRPNERLPWNGVAAPYGMLVAPITNIAHARPIGGIAIVLPRVLSDQSREIDGMLPAVQSLGAQIGAALYAREVYQQRRDLDRLSQDLHVASTIQQSFLPETLPVRPGWQFAARLRPARQTSGDFYDVFELPSGQIALVMADVADKGTGPALYMAATRTLIRTYAFEHPAHPDVVLWAANQRILNDSHTSLFVTVFYAVLDTVNGLLTYANAGHNPPLLSNNGIHPLRNTGIPLGIETDAFWYSVTTTVAPGSALMLYTDGVTEAQTADGDFFGNDRLLKLAEVLANLSAAEGAQRVFDDVDAFVGDAPQFDDQTLLIVRREGTTQG